MKKILLSVLVFLCVGGWKISHAESIHCDAFYQGKPFVQVTIWTSDVFGRAECDYKNSGDKNLTVFKFPASNEYYVVAGYWRSTMPGTRWCSVEDGDTFESCVFAKRE